MQIISLSLRQSAATETPVKLP